MAVPASFWMRRLCCPVVALAMLMAMWKEPSRSQLLQVLPPVIPPRGWLSTVEFFAYNIATRSNTNAPVYDEMVQMRESQTEEAKNIRAMLDSVFEEADKRRTTYDRVGTWVLVALMAIATFAPMIAAVYYVGAELWRRFLKPWWPTLWRYCILEALCYLVSIDCIAQAFRPGWVPTRSVAEKAAFFLSDRATDWMLVGSLGLLLSWRVTLRRHSPPPKTARENVKEFLKEQKEQAETGVATSPPLDLDYLAELGVGAAMQAAVPGAAAVLTRSHVAGTWAVLSVYILIVAMASVNSVSKTGRRLTMANAQAMLRCCAEVSFAISVTVCLLFRLKGADAWMVARPFGEGMALCGHTMYFVSIVALASSSWGLDDASWRLRNTVVLLSIGLAALGGWLLEAPALYAAAFTFLLLFFLMKELEVSTKASWESALKLAAFVMILRAIYMNSSYSAPLLDPTNLYA